MPTSIVRVDAIRSVEYSSITSSYTTLGGSFSHAMRVIKLTNNTDGDLLISFDGVTDNVILPAGSFTLYDVTTNREENDIFFVFQVGTQVFVKYSTSPAKGAVYLECLYGQGE